LKESGDENVLGVEDQIMMRESDDKYFRDHMFRRGGTRRTSATAG
jgi:hypothetical protein